ncbi:MAG TPA: hypothetical protein VHN37_14880 [Actinomycetota bacterium]|nr:hypothetical protein [Actinomycetota bacterium]
MLKKTLVSLLAAALVAAPTATGAFAKGKKKKGPKPYVSETIDIRTGHTAAYGTSGTLLTVTAQEFIQTCALPNSNGVDAAVYEVPADYKGITASIKAVGTGAAAAYDLDLYLFDEACSIVGVYNPVGTDEIGFLTPDTAFVVVHNYEPGPVTAHIELAPTK